MLPKKVTNNRYRLLELVVARKYCAMLKRGMEDVVVVVAISRDGSRNATIK